MRSKVNKGIDCDVCVCKHNINGCNCNLKNVRITSGDTESMHFCGSYECDAKQDN